MKKLFRLSLFMLIVGVSFLSCDKDEIQHIPISSQADRIDWFVTSNDVFRLLESEEGLYFREEDNTKEILEKKSVGDESEHPLFYIINFKEGGFAIIAGDKRSLPILAYSKIGYFDLDSRIIPLGLLNWLEETAEKIRGLRTGKYKGLNETEQNLLWSKNSFDEIFHPDYYVEPIDPDDPCDDSYTIIKDPLLNSIWGQRRAFNDEIEFENCTAGTSPTGCVATAMGQVMRFHESPTVFNWSNMPLGPFGNNEIALLMEDIGDEVDMNYTCESSGSTMSNARSALKNEYGFSNAKLADYYSPTVKSNINNNKPVILAGYRKGEEHCFLWWCWNDAEDGHAWVADGYRYSYHCESGQGFLSFYMNWGWYGTANGFYSSWTPLNFDFTFEKKMIYNINP